MNSCQCCGKETSNLKFCSLSCSSKRPQRKVSRIGYCENAACGQVFDKSNNMYKRYCSRNCAAVINNARSPKRSSKISSKLCPGCGIGFRRIHEFCSGKCRSAYLQKAFIESWLAGKEDGVSGNSGTNVRIKRHLLAERGNKCEECGWNEINPHTGKVPVQLEHRDGDWKNNAVDNLLLLCPNCHSLTSTYGGANVGKGRPGREAWRKNLALVV